MVPADAAQGRCHTQDVSSVETCSNYCTRSFCTFLSSLEHKGGGEGNSNWLSTDSGGKLDGEKTKKKGNPLWDGTFGPPFWPVQWHQQGHHLLLPSLKFCGLHTAVDVQICQQQQQLETREGNKWLPVAPEDIGIVRIPEMHWGQLGTVPSCSPGILQTVQNFVVWEDMQSRMGVIYCVQ